MSQQPMLYRHAQLLAPKRSNPEEARMISRLADKAIALAEEYGETLTREAAIQRAKENLAYVHQLSLVREMEMARNPGIGGVRESEWRP